MPILVERDRNAAKKSQHRHPEHDRTVEPPPIRCDLVEERLHGIRVMLDVFDRVIARDEGVDDDGGGNRHHAGEEVERSDAAFNQPA